MKLSTRIIVGLAILVVPTLAHAMDCKANKVYCKIVTLNPNMDKSTAFKLSNVIHREAKLAGMDPMVSVAILQQENAFMSRNTFHEEKTVNKSCDEKGCYEEIVIKKSAVDLGIAQINVHTAKNYGLNIERLFNLTDLDYAIKAHFLILKDKVKMCSSSLGPDAWTCYHSTTEFFRLQYKDLVSRYL